VLDNSIQRQGILKYNISHKMSVKLDVKFRRPAVTPHWWLQTGGGGGETAKRASGMNGIHKADGPIRSILLSRHISTLP